MELPSEIDSKFRFILIAARRARQLQSGAKALIQAPTKKVTRVAQLEVQGGLVPFEVLEPNPTDDEKAKKSKSSK